MSAEAQPTRDYEVEMRQLVEEWTPPGDWVAAIQGSKLFAHLMENDPDLFCGWALGRGPSLLTRYITENRHSDRMSGLRREGARAFSKAVAESLEGDTYAVSVFEDVKYVVDDENTCRSLGDLTGKDCFFVADTYAERARRNAMEEAFLRALGKKVGDQRVRDVFTEERVLELRASITR